MHYCEICDEEWPVFDGEWPRSGEQTCGPLAGKCETIKRWQGFEAATWTLGRCSRCASSKSAYYKQYRRENGQHLGPTHEQLNVLTWYESLLVARVHPVISVLTLMSTGLLCYAGHVCNYYVKTFDWFNSLPALLQDKKWFLVKRRKSIHGTDSESRRKKPTTANRWRLVAAIVELFRCMPNVFRKSEINPKALQQLPAEKDREQEMTATEPDPKTRELDLRGEVMVKPDMFAAWLGYAPTSAGRCPCATSILCFVTDLQGEDLRGSVTADSAWEVICRYLEQYQITQGGAQFVTVLGTSMLATLVQHLIDKSNVSVELRDRVYKGMIPELQMRGKSIEAANDEDAMKHRWIKQTIHEELDLAKDSWIEEAKVVPVDLEVDGDMQEVEQVKSLTNEAEEEAAKVMAGVAGSPVATAMMDPATDDQTAYYPVEEFEQPDAAVAHEQEHEQELR